MNSLLLLLLPAVFYHVGASAIISLPSAILFSAPLASGMTTPLSSARISIMARKIYRLTKTKASSSMIPGNPKNMWPPYESPDYGFLTLEVGLFPFSAAGYQLFGNRNHG
jgi:hypothetical protein